MTQDDWLAVAVFRAASDQYINQTPLGRGEGKPPILTPRLEGWESALRLSNIEATPSDIDAAVLLFHLVNGSEGWEINWIKETGKTQYEIEPEDLNGAD